MADRTIRAIVRDYLKEIAATGIPISYGILFGSYSGSQKRDRWSDIDLLVVSPIYDKLYTRNEINFLWRIAARIDSRIEPIAVGTHQFEIDDTSTILEVARREGEKIYLQDIQDSVL